MKLLNILIFLLILLACCTDCEAGESLKKFQQKNRGDVTLGALLVSPFEFIFMKPLPNEIGVKFIPGGRTITVCQRTDICGKDGKGQSTKKKDTDLGR